MGDKERYIKIIEERFKGSIKNVLLQQLELFYEDNNTIKKNKYNVGEDVKLSKGTFIHGIFGGLDNFDFTINNGFISADFTTEPRPNKICNSVGMWNIKEDILLKDYINLYSGFTITCSIGRGHSTNTVSKLVPYHKFDEITEQINDDENIWSWWGDQTKEVRFLPSLVATKRQIAFILNMESDYAKEMAYNDVWNTDFTEEQLKSFINEKY